MLVLVARGLSNLEIAERLFLSVNSVKTHVRAAYRKIGVSRRVDAVRWVLTHDLAGADEARVGPGS